MIKAKSDINNDKLSTATFFETLRVVITDKLDYIQSMNATISYKTSL